jgi:hypothetical protein
MRSSGDPLIKKKIKFSSYILQGNSEWSSCKVIYEEGLPNIWGNAQIFPHIWGRLSVIYETLKLLHSEFPYMWGKFYFIFYQCSFADWSSVVVLRAGKDSRLYECPIYRKPARTDLNYIGSIGTAWIYSSFRPASSRQEFSVSAIKFRP